MPSVMFYHLTRRTVAETLAPLAEKALERGWRVAVRGKDSARLDHLDQALWLGPDERFLAHGQAGGEHDADQPILLTTDANGPAANGATCLIAVDGATVAADEVSNLDRVCILFDGADAAALQHAREQWTALTSAGLGAQYWSEESGRWEMKSER